jgi:protein disulfide-isomerase
MRRLLISAVVLVGLAGTFVNAADEAWLTDFDKAKKAAEEKKLPILADFAGSDWCGWCKKLDKEVFSQESFKKYAKDNLVLLLVDFPYFKEQPEKEKAQNKNMAAKFGVEGFPTVLLIGADGKELARTGYKPGGADAYVEHVKELLKKAAEKK